MAQIREVIESAGPDARTAPLNLSFLGGCVNYWVTHLDPFSPSAYSPSPSTVVDDPVR